jgi:dTDP-4-amino-4,6-dideoxygalactose transaminase
LFVIQVDDQSNFQNYCNQNQIQTLIHYPIPPHKQRAYVEYNNSNLPITEDIHKKVVSLPISPVMGAEEIKIVIKTLNNY